MAITRYSSLITVLFCAAMLLLSGCANMQTGANPWGTPKTTTSNPVDTSYSPSPAPVRYGTDFNALPPVKVAILLPLSGANAALGQSMLQGAQLALFEMGYTNFELMPRDTAGNAIGARAAATSAINEGAQLILGPVFADSVRAAQGVAKQRGINMIAFSTDWSLANRQTFLMGFMPFSQVDRVAQYALKNGYQDFAVVAPQDQYGDIVTSRFVQNINKNGGRIGRTIRFTPGDANVINKIESLKPQNGSPSFKAVFMPVGGSQVETISSALSYNKLMPTQIKRIGTGLWDDPRIASQPNMQNAWFASPSPSARLAFEKKYQATYGERPIRLATLAYDATALAATLAKNGYAHGGVPAYDYNAITNPNGFAGTDGVFRFGKDGLVERALAVLEIRNGKIIEIDPAPKRF